MTTPRTIELPDFDTGQYEGARFVMEDGDAHLTITIAEVGDARFTFRRARWHQFTSLHSCDVQSRLLEVENSPQVTAILKADSAAPRPYGELHHFKIFLDETGCHEVVAETATLEVRQRA